MYNLLIFVSILMIIAIGIIWIIVTSDAKKNKQYAHATFTAAICAFMLYLAFLTSPTLSTARVFSNLYYSTTLWLLYFVQNFTRGYAQVKNPKSKLRFIFAALCVIDTIFGIYNIFTDTFYVITFEQVFRTRLCFWNIHPKKLFILHFINGFLIILHTCAVLLVKIKKSPTMYKSDYLKFLVAFIVILVINLCVNIFSIPLDISMFMFAFIADSLFLYPSTRGHRRLISQTLKFSANNTKSAFCCYNEENEIAFINEAAFKIFEIDTKNSEKPVEFLNDFITKYNLQDKDRFSVEETFFLDNANHIYAINYEKMYQNNFFIGTALTFTDRTEDIKEYDAERYKANHDPLTGLYNRNYFYERANEKLKSEPSAKWLMLTSNIQDFKIINETQGDEVGDEVLKYTAELIARYAHKDTIYGYIADDHFAVLLKEEDFNEDIFNQSVVNLSSITDISGFKLSMKIGVYKTEYAMESAMLMVDKANLAIANAEESNHDLFVEYNPKYMKKLLYEKNILADYNYALKTGEFKVFLQKVNTKDGKTYGAEALVRWIEPGAKPKLPKDFIDTLEEGGLLYKLDRYIWEEAAKILQSWTQDKKKKNWLMSINIAPKDFHYLDVFKEISDLAKQYNFEPEKLILEITEDSLLNEREKVIKTMTELHEQGFKIALDNYGDNYSSINLLQDFEIDILKFDSDFMKHSINKEKEAIILKNIVEMAKMMDIQIVAENVETQEQLETLSKLKFALFQGFYFSKPVPAKDFE